jgi:hypothetical protein
MIRVAMLMSLFIFSISIAWSETFWVYKKSDGTEVTTSKWEYIPEQYRAGAYKKEVDPQFHNKAPISSAPDTSIKMGKARRNEFAREFQNRMLDKGFDAYISTDGPEDTTLEIRWISIDRPFVHKFWKDIDTVTLRSLGFKRVRFDNGLSGGAKFRQEYEL